MKKQSTFLKISFKTISKIAFSLFLISQSLSAQSVYNDYQDGKIWLKVKNNTVIDVNINEDNRHVNINNLSFIASLSKSYGVTNLSIPFAKSKHGDLKRIYLVEFSDISNVDKFIKAIEASGKVEYAEKVPISKTTLTPNDPSYGSQWGLAKINSTTAWDYSTGSSSIVVAIVDDAVLRSHPDLIGNVWVNPGEIANNNIDDDNNGYIDDINGYDVADMDNNPNPTNNSYDHGTHVAGIVGAEGNNNTGVASIGFGVSLMCVKSTSTPVSITNGYDGVVYAADNGADVINMSWGGSGFSQTGQNIMNYAYGQGCVLIAAAGNSNVNTLFYPAAFTNVISVAATSSNDAKASFSNYGNWIDVSAPGDNIYATVVGNTYGNKSGTSMASPMVAGLCGLMLSLNPGLSQAYLTNCLLSTADNINAQNPGYIGQLGSGRINANAAMNCVDLSLSFPPTADFIASYTTLNAGGQTQFTDLSSFTPTTWTWTFTGGTPASFVGQNPPNITYNTAGTYTVTLVATNANGSDTETKTGYIIVNPSGGCDTVNWQYVTGQNPVWNLTQYYVGGGGVGQNGWINGKNATDNAKIKAQYYDLTANPKNFLTGAFLYFGRAYSANQNKVVPVKVYDGTAGTPGAVLATLNLTMGQIMSDVQNNYLTRIEFPTPINIPASKKFFIGIDLTNLSWAATKDTLSLVSNTDPESTPAGIWEQQQTNNWFQYGNAGTWNVFISAAIFPFVTNVPTVATYTQSAITVCEGNVVNFNATGSTVDDTLLFVFPGGSPNYSNNIQQSVLYNTPGTYNVVLYVQGGGCHNVDSLATTVTVLPKPTVSVTAAQGTICIGGSTQLTATGAPSFTWSPATGLSCTNCANPVANPTQTTTYTVSGTGANGCVGTTLVTIIVEPVPVSVVTESTTNSCTGQLITFDGSLSSNVNTFAWTFVGGTPATSNTSVPVVSYSTVGTYTATLTTTNNCGSDNSYTKTITVIQSPTVTVTPSSDTICAGDLVGVTITAGGASTYTWSPAAGLNVNNAATVIATPAQTTTYTVVGTAANGCPDSISVTITVDPCLGIDDLINNNTISTMYNSGIDALTLTINNRMGAKSSKLSVVNSLGQIVYSSDMMIVSGENKLYIDMAKQADGIYYIRMMGEKRVYSSKFVKN